VARSQDLELPPTSRRDLRYVDSNHSGLSRPSTCPFDHRLHGGRRSLELGSDRPVGLVAYVPDDAETERFSPAGVTKEHALDPAMHDNSPRHPRSVAQRRHPSAASLVPCRPYRRGGTRIQQHNPVTVRRFAVNRPTLRLLCVVTRSRNGDSRGARRPASDREAVGGRLRSARRATRDQSHPRRLNARYSPPHMNTISTTANG